VEIAQGHRTVEIRCLSKAVLNSKTAIISGVKLEQDEKSIEREREPQENPYVAKFLAFFESVGKPRIERSVSEYPKKRSLEIDFKELEEFDYELADELLDNPDYLLEAARTAIQSVEVPALEIESFAPHIRFHNIPKDREILVRNIGSEYLNKLISVEGAVSQITDALPKLKIATWQCRRCGNTYKTPQEGQELKQPAFCECRHRDFTLVQNQSEFVDYQKIKIQEPLEKLKGNEQASNLDVYLGDDLVHKVSAGNTVRFVGILRLSPAQGKKIVFGRFLEVLHVEETQREFEEVEVLPEEEKEIRKLSKDPKIYEMLIGSIAPAIYGHESVKESIVLQLFGGVKKELPGNQTIRGNVHILLVGDPGTGKSQILQATNSIAPKSIYTAGRTTSGVGLTAAAVKDDFGEGGWTLKAGALVLASGGLCMADELDKMNNDDRVALHEAMEQGMVSVAKAGIVTRFKSDTSILAAANPKFSRFDPYTPFISQIELPPTLISRFDLFYMIRDVLDRTKDEQISSHILKTHRLGEMISQYSKKGKKMKKTEEEALKKIATPEIDADMLRKYISYARQTVSPILSMEATQAINDFYLELRDMGRDEGSYAATHRQLEGLVRLSEASARVRLSDVVEPQDAARAIRLVRSSLKDMVTDPETGKIDYDIIATGQTHTQITNMKKILGIVKSKAADVDMVPLQEVLEEAKTEGIDEDKARDIIDKLEKKGEIYKPRHGFLKPTHRS
tara:strand:- start:825 stop:3032 length:2208 start_codon:yes stop_codon:yes gene_type:complete